MENKKYWIMILAGVAIVLFFFEIGMNINSASDMEGTTVQTEIAVSVDNQVFSLDLESENRVVELTSLNTEFEVPIIFTYDGSVEVKFDGIPVDSGIVLPYQFKHIEPDYYVPVEITSKLTGKTSVFSIRTYPQSLPRYTVIGKSPYLGDYYLNPNNIPGGAIYKIGRNGNVLYYTISAADSLWDFKKVQTEQGTRYLYSESVASVHTAKAYTTPVEWVVMDERYHEIKRIRMEKSDVLTDIAWPADQHDILYINDDEYYLITYVSKHVNNIPADIPHKNGSSVAVAAVIQGFQNQKLFFEWDSTDFPELYGFSCEYNDFTNTTDLYADYMHVNSVDLDKRDGNLIVSFRNLDSILKLDTATGQILWKLGGKGDEFGLTEDQKTSRQHYARCNSNGSITVFDNGNDKKQTRVVEYWLDEKNKTVKKFQKYQIDGYYSWATGSAQRIDDKKDIFVIGWGMRGDEAPLLQPNLSEIDFSSGTTLFELTFDNQLTTYRCVKYQ